MRLEDSIFQRTVPLYAMESFIKCVLKHGTSSELHAVIEFDRLFLFSIELISLMHVLLSYFYYYVLL